MDYSNRLPQTSDCCSRSSSKARRHPPAKTNCRAIQNHCPLNSHFKTCPTLTLNHLDPGQFSGKWCIQIVWVKAQPLISKPRLIESIYRCATMWCERLQERSADDVKEKTLNISTNIIIIVRTAIQSYILDTILHTSITNVSVLYLQNCLAHASAYYLTSLSKAFSTISHPILCSHTLSLMASEDHVSVTASGYRA